jgi:GNAT superfamily N-acetyltransferase
MQSVRIRWQDAEALRVSVLGWAAGAVPGDDEPASIHLAQRDDAGDVIAVVSFMLHPCPERPHVRAVYLWGIGVLPAWQRRGIGSQLLAEVVAEARGHGAGIVWADARETAVPFYQRAGAVVSGPRIIDEVTGLPDRRVILAVRPSP